VSQSFKVPTSLKVASWFCTGAAVHLASLLAAYGYIFSITDHHLMVKDDASYYRFQVGHGYIQIHLSTK